MNKYLVSTIVHEGNDAVVSSLQPADNANDAFIAHVAFFAAQQCPNNADDQCLIRETTIGDRCPIVATTNPIVLPENNDDCNSHVILRVK